jgi:proteasome lid subunit RPN8/RPN11
MSLEKLSPESMKKQLPRMQLKFIVPLIMPLNVLHQIQYLCKTISEVEWSGILFYTTEGSITNPETFKVILKTILPLDKGTKGYTEYALDERFLNFIEEDFEERCTWKVGHIHSHNSMAVFFSGTDMAELNDNAPSHNFYLTLIVNNAMDFMAKIAFTAQASRDIKQVPYQALNEEGNKYTIEKADFVVNTTKLFIYDCEIDSPLIKVETTEDFIQQVAKIMIPKPVVKPVANPVDTKKIEPFSKNNKKKQYQFEDWGKPLKKVVPFSQFADPNLFEDEDEFDISDEDPEYDLKMSAIYEFAKDIFDFTGTATTEDYLEDVLDLLAEFDMSPSEIASQVVLGYTKSFAKHFPEANAQDFVGTTHELLDLLEDEVATYPEIKLTIKTITKMIEKFITNG